MKLSINKCPKCNSKDFYILNTGRATCQLNKIFAPIVKNNKVIYEVEDDGGEWNWDKLNYKEMVRCSNCNYSLKRYILSYESK